MIKRPSPQAAQQLAHDLGALFLNFGVLEHTLSLAIAAALKLSDIQERALVRDMYPNQKLNLLTSHAKKYWNEKVQEDWRLLNKRITEIVEYRNAYAHGHIFHNEHGEFELIRFRGPDRFEGGAEQINAIRLASAVQEIPLLCGLLQQLADDLTAGKALRPQQQP